VLNQPESIFTEPRCGRLELVFRDIEHQEVLFRRTRCWQTALVAGELKVPVAPWSADEHTVVAVMPFKPTQPFKSQDVDIEMQSRRNVTHGSSDPHRRWRELSGVHDFHCRGEARRLIKVTTFRRDPVSIIARNQLRNYIAYTSPESGMCE